MTRKEVKILMPVFKAYVDGKTLQIRRNGEDTWYDTTHDGLNFDLSEYEYRVKPELKNKIIKSKYRPFINKEECLQEMMRHNPVGWLNDTIAGEYVSINYIKNNIMHFNTLFERYVFIDGSPVGILI